MTKIGAAQERARITNKNQKKEASWQHLDKLGELSTDWAKEVHALSKEPSTGWLLLERFKNWCSSAASSLGKRLSGSPKFAEVNEKPSVTQRQPPPTKKQTSKPTTLWGLDDTPAQSRKTKSKPSQLNTAQDHGYNWEDTPARKKPSFFQQLIYWAKN